ncbi:tryptophanase-like [Acropora palmata]
MQEYYFTTFFEPFRIKSVEKLKETTRDERIKYLKQANYNLYLLDSENILIDLLTDSGTGAMSSEQWAAVMLGDESYAGSPSYRKFETVVKEIFGYRHVIPTHQGRAAERILFRCTVKEGDIVPNNAHFATTMANIEAQGGQAKNFLTPEALEPSRDVPFKGNMNIEKLESMLAKAKEKVPLVMITITNNMVGGEPVSMENIKAVSKLCRSYGIPLFFDACRFAENAWFIKIKEDGYANRTPKDIAREIFSYGDGCTMSAKKDGLANIGGFLAVNDEELASKCRKELLITEGFTTYGGLAGRDLEAIAVGLNEVVEEDYLRYQVGFVKFLADLFVQNHVPIVTPPGGHAVYIDAGAMLPHIPRENFPAWALGCALYIEGGIRGAEVGAVMLGSQAGKQINDVASRSSHVDDSDFKDENELDDNVFEEDIEHEELFRLAIPRRTYTESHMRYVAEVCAHIYKNRSKVCGYQITWEPPMLRHFTAHLEPIPLPSLVPEEDDQDKKPQVKKKVSTGQVLRRRKNSSMQFS